MTNEINLISIMLQSLSKKYFDGRLSKGFVFLYTGKTITMITMALLGIFLPIFLYELFDKNFSFVVIYYGAGYFLYGLLVAIGVRFLNKFGFRRALRTSVILGALFYVIFYFMDKGNLNYLIPLSVLILVLYRMFYWLPYHVDLAKFTNHINRGRQLSILSATRQTAGIFIPLIAGFIVAYYGFDILFIIDCNFLFSAPNRFINEEIFSLLCL